MDTLQKPKRRKFIRIGSAGALATSVGGLPALLGSSIAHAQQVLGDDTFATLTKIARDIFPHDRFEDDLYRKAVAPYGDPAKQDAALKTLLTEGVASVDAAAKQKYGKRYVEVVDEKDRVAILKAMDKSPFFLKVRGDLVVSLYNQPSVWAKLGYQGPSAEFGGYITRGFNDQTWMDSV
jgi:hypothetical protein